jgi:DNA-binding Xre family transcriptional regulator
MPWGSSCIAVVISLHLGVIVNGPSRKKNNSDGKYFYAIVSVKGGAMAAPYDIAPRVREAVERSGLRKADIARRAVMTWAQLQKIINGERPQVSADTVRRLAIALNISTDYLLGLVDEPGPSLKSRTKRAAPSVAAGGPA